MTRLGTLDVRWTFAMAVFVLMVGAAAAGPIKTDGSFGRPAVEVQPEGHEYRIGRELGERRGHNLFYSFERFGIPENETATFLRPPHNVPSIHNVMARVTGSDRSEIQGTLRSELPNADVWLINPNGVVFGRDAKIDVPRALHVSTADDIRLTDGQIFSASDPAPMTLTSAAPEAFGFLGTGAQPEIRFETFTRFGPDQESHATRLNLVGGAVIVDGADLRSLGERPPDIGIVATEGRLSVRIADIAGNGPPAVAAASGGSIRILRSAIDTRGAGNEGGNIVLAGDTIVIDGSLLDARGDPGGTIRISGGAVRIGSQPDAKLDAIVGGLPARTGRSGPILIEGDTVRIVRGGAVRSATDRTGSDNRLTITAERIVVNDGVISSSALVGPAAPIELSAERVSIRNGGLVTSGPGPSSLCPCEAAAGTIAVHADRWLRIEGNTAARFTGIGTSTTSHEGGNVIIDAPAGEVRIVGGAEIRSRATRSAVAGDLTIDAQRLMISRDGSDQFTGIASSAGESSTKGGDAGAILVRAHSIEIGDLGAIASDSSGGGNAGSVTVKAGRIELREGGQISSLTLPSDGTTQESTGRGGSVTVTARQSVTIAGEGPRPQRVHILEVDDDGQLRRVPRLIKPPSSITASSESPAGRRAGDVQVEAPVIRISDHGEISSESFNERRGGKVTVRAFDRLEIDNGEITTKANFADAGDIQITSKRLIDLMDDGEISTTVSKRKGNAGNINITAPSLALNDSRIQANGDAGRGGDITIASDALIQTPASVIEALSDESVDGEVEVRRPDDPTSGLVALEASLEERTELVADPCEIRADRPISALVVRPVYPDLPDPEQPLSAPRARPSTTAQRAC